METNLQRPQRLFAQPVRYEVPDFQRRYVWKQDEQWEPLWDDAADLAESIMEDGRTEVHFMGAVVLQQVPFATGTIERRVVVDGLARSASQRGDSERRSGVSGVDCAVA